MRIGWMSIDGTLDYNTTGFLGTSQCTRIPMMKEFVRQGDDIYWFGIKPNSNILDGKQVPSFFQLWDSVCKPAFRRYWESQKEIGGSRLRYRFTKTVEKILKELNRRFITLPNLDVLCVQFQDVNPAAICWELAWMLYYLRNGTKVIVYDTDLELRYSSTFEGKTRDNKYPSPLFRWLSDELSKPFKNLHMMYVCDPGSDPFYLNLYHTFPVYDKERELPIFHKFYDYVYVGNDKTKIQRRDAFHNAFGGSVNKEKIAVFGKWEDTDFNSKYPYIHFGGRVPSEWMMPTIGMGLASPYLINTPRAKIAFKADRLCEVAQAGTITTIQKDFVDLGNYILQDFVYKNEEESLSIISTLKKMWKRNPNKYIDAVETQRNLLREQWSPTKMYEEILSIKNGNKRRKHKA